MKSIANALPPATELPAEKLDGETLAEQMRKDIRTGTLAPGSPLRIRDLADRYQISPIPIREALQQLKGEGLIELEYNRGARVRELTAQAAADVCGILEAMESYFARRLAEIASPFQLAKLDEIEDRHATALQGSDMRAIMQLNNEFHDYLNHVAGNPAAEQVVWRQKVLMGTIRIEVGFGDVRRQHLSEEHRGIIRAARARDPDTAARIAAMHARSSKDDLIERMIRQGL